MKKLQEKLQAKAKAFTLVELIVVVIIIGILAAIAIPRMMDVRKSAQEGADVATARTIVSMVATASMDMGGDLSKLNDSTANVPGVTPATSYQKHYLDKIKNSVDVDVVYGSAPTGDQWGVLYNSGKIEVYKVVDGTAKKIYEK